MIFDPQLPFIHPSKFDWSEIHVPQPVVNLLETDVLLFKRLRDGNANGPPTESAIPTYEPLFKMRGIFDRWQTLGVFTNRRLVNRCRRLLVERLMRSFDVEFFAEAIESKLLASEGRRGRTRAIAIVGRTV